MKRYLIVIYTVLISAYGILVLLSLIYKNTNIPGISSAPFYVFLVLAAPFLFIGLINNILNKKSINNDTSMEDDACNESSLNIHKVVSNTGIDSIKYSRNDKIYAIISFVKVPLIFIAVFGGIALLIAFAMKLLVYLTKH